MVNMDDQDLPKVGQLGIVVDDVEKGVAYYSKMFNITNWNRMLYTPEKAVWNGKKASFKFKLAFADIKDINLELIQVAEGHIQHSDFLRKTGGGVHHFGFYVNDLQEWVDRYQKKGIPVLMDLEGIVGSRGRRRALFFDTSPGGVLFEFIQIL